MDLAAPAHLDELAAVCEAAASPSSMAETQALVLCKFAALIDLTTFTAAVGDTEPSTLNQLLTIRSTAVPSTSMRLAQPMRLRLLGAIGDAAPGWYTPTLIRGWHQSAGARRSL